MTAPAPAMTAARANPMLATLRECEEFLDNLADVRDDGCGSVQPNRAMVLLDQVRRALTLFRADRAVIAADSPYEYLVWSGAHGAWWRSFHADGYTLHLDAAGRFTRDAAITICASAREGYRDGAVLTEVPVRLDDMLAIRERAAEMQPAGRTP